MYFYKKTIDKSTFMYYNIIVNKKYIKTGGHKNEIKKWKEINKGEFVTANRGGGNLSRCNNEKEY